jgi:diguanylate cyclase (GGDEF)-like protein
MLQPANSPAPDHSWLRYRLGLDACRGAFRSFEPKPIAIAAAAAMMSLLALTGALDPVERQLSDAWFGASDIAPSGRIILATFDRSSARYANTPRLPRRDLADLLLKLDAAGVSRILIEVGLGDLTNEADDRYLEQVLTRLGRKAAMSATAVRAGNQTSWRRTGPLDRFARHAVRTASDLALDGDRELRAFGIADSGLRPLVAGSAWLSGRDYDPAHASDVARIDFAIDLRGIPTFDAAAILQGTVPLGGLAGASVIVNGFLPPGNGGFRVPRYATLNRPQVTALAAETLLLGRDLRVWPRWAATFGLPLLAGLIAFLCMRKGVLAAAATAICMGASALGTAAALQVWFGLITPGAGALAAVLLGYAAAELAVRAVFQRMRDTVAAVLAGTDIEALQRVAREDALTGLSNRRVFEEAVKRACLAAEGGFALLMCDLDGFKQVNDTLGHAAGDALLREIAKRLVAAVGSDAVVARLGGDEFAILIGRGTPALAGEIAQRVLAGIAQPIWIGGQPVRVGGSIGVALGAQRQDMRQLLESADAAMYEAKRSGSGYRLAAPPPPSVVSSVLEAEAV